MLGARAGAQWLKNLAVMKKNKLLTPALKKSSNGLATFLAVMFYYT
jgi:hypothetical protein